MKSCRIHRLQVQHFMWPVSFVTPSRPDKCIKRSPLSARVGIAAGSDRRCWSDKIMTVYVEEQVRKCTQSEKKLWCVGCGIVSKILNLWMPIFTTVNKYRNSYSIFVGVYEWIILKGLLNGLWGRGLDLTGCECCSEADCCDCCNEPWVS
jgi:hypothetical protein